MYYFYYNYVKEWKQIFYKMSTDFQNRPRISETDNSGPNNLSNHKTQSEH